MGEESLKNLSEKILDEIKQSHIKPVPKWEFLLKRWVVWVFFLVAVILGSLAVSIILFITLNSRLPRDLSLVQKFILTLPYFWILILALFTFIAYYNFRITDKGYQKKAYTILFSSILASLILGSGIYAFGGGEKLESLFYQHVPLYHKLMHEKAKWLVEPNKGRIAGEAERVELQTFVIRDFSGRIWIVTVPTTTPNFVPGRRLIIYGQQTEDGRFKAEAIQELYESKSVFFNKKLSPIHLFPPEDN